MAIKFSQLPKVGSIDPDSLIPIVDVSLGGNTLGVVTGSTLTTLVSNTVSSSITTLQNEIDSVTGNVATAQTSINSLISGAAAASNNINALQIDVAAIQNSGATVNAQIVTLQSGATATNIAITTANTAMKGYVDARDAAVTAAWTANAATTIGIVNGLSTSKANVASPTFTGTVTLPATNVGGDIAPTANVTYNLGSSSAWWNTIYGKAVQAQYADLAELYLPDTEYTVGTVVMVGGSAEVTACQFGNRAIGAISANPSYLMNSGLEGGVPVALTGRVPLKVIGTVKKGQNLIAGNNGCATAAVYHSSEVFAIALESSADAGEKLVEALVL